MGIKDIHISLKKGSLFVCFSLGTGFPNQPFWQEHSGRIEQLTSRYCGKAISKKPSQRDQ